MRSVRDLSRPVHDRALYDCTTCSPTRTAACVRRRDRGSTRPTWTPRAGAGLLGDDRSMPMLGAARGCRRHRLAGPPAPCRRRCTTRRSPRLGSTGCSSALEVAPGGAADAVAAMRGSASAGCRSPCRTRRTWPLRRRARRCRSALRSVNTVAPRRRVDVRDGTDGAGFVASSRAPVPSRAGAVVVLGAGERRSIVDAPGCATPRTWRRQPQRRPAEACARRPGRAWSGRRPPGADIVSSTPLGRDGGDELPRPPASLHAGQVRRRHRVPPARDGAAARGPAAGATAVDGLGHARAPGGAAAAAVARRRRPTSRVDDRRRMAERELAARRQ